MAIALQTVVLHFDIPKPGMRILDERIASYFVDNLFVTAFYDHCIYDATNFGVDYELVFSPDKPWEFAKNAAVPATLTTVKLVYNSYEADVFYRISDDIAAAFPGMNSCRHVDGPLIDVTLSCTTGSLLFE